MKMEHGSIKQKKNISVSKMGKKKDLQLLNSKLHKKMAGKSNTDIKLKKRKFI